MVLVGGKKKYDFASNYGEFTIQVKVKVCSNLDSIMKNQANFFFEVEDPSQTLMSALCIKKPIQ